MLSPPVLSLLCKLLCNCVVVVLQLTVFRGSVSPCSSLIRHFQTVQVGLRPAAASLLQLVAVAGQEGARRVVGLGIPLAVMLRVPLIGYVVGVFKATILVTNGCQKKKKTKDCFWTVHSEGREARSSPVRWLTYLEVPAPTSRGCSGEFWTH